MIPSLYEKGYIISYKEGDISLQRTIIPLSGDMGDRYHVVVDGETLLDIAQRYYDDQLLWYILADVNSELILDIFDLEPNLSILIPDLSLLEVIYG